MKRKLAGVTAAALAAGLIVSSVGTGAPAHRAAVDGDSARAKATDKFKGNFKGQPDSVIKIKGKSQNGEVTRVKSMRYTALMDCEKTKGEVTGSAGWTFTPGGIPVNSRRKFKVSGNNGLSPVSTLTFKGKFNSKFTKVKGKFKTHQWFEAEGKLPAEYCDLPTTRYVAKD